MEFRHASRWDEETAAVLSRHRAAFVAVSHPRLPADVVPTADVLSVRFHGARRLYDHDDSMRELEAWVERLRPHLGGRILYASFTINNNDRNANAPRNAAAFSGTSLPDR